MAEYIGRDPYTSNFNTDTFTGNNGATYTLTYSPGSANSILIFIDGVYQMPGVSNSYTVSNKILTFTENVSSLSTIFVVYLGLAAAIGTPGVGTVSFTQLDPVILPPGIMWDYGGVAAPSGWLLCDGTAYSRSSFSGLFTAIGTTYGNGTGNGLDFSVPDFRGRLSLGSGTAVYSQAVLPAAVNTGTNQITITANDSLKTGTPVTYTTTGTQINGLIAGNPYFVISVSSTLISLTSTLANAQNGTGVITFSTQGTGVHSFTVNSFIAKVLGAIGGEEAHAMTIAQLLSHNHIQNAHTHIQDPHSHTATVFNNDVTGGFGRGSGGGTASPSTDATTATNQVTTATNNPAGGNAALNVLSPYTVVNKIIKT